MAKVSTKNATQALGYRLRNLPHFIYEEILAAMKESGVHRHTIVTTFKRVDFELVPNKTMRPILSVLNKYKADATIEDILDIEVVFYFEPEASLVYMKRAGEKWSNREAAQAEAA